jgi:hypothetical protein
MKDYMEIGSVPASEPCAQVGNDDYHKLSRIECRTFKEQLMRLWSEKLLPGMYFTIKTFPHDFGSYSEVCIVYDDADEAQTDMAVEIQNEMPETWDSEAKKDMKEQEYVLVIK